MDGPFDQKRAAKWRKIPPLIFSVKYYMAACLSGIDHHRRESQAFKASRWIHQHPGIYSKEAKLKDGKKRFWLKLSTRGGPIFIQLWPRGTNFSILIFIRWITSTHLPSIRMQNRLRQRLQRKQHSPKRWTIEEIKQNGLRFQKNAAKIMAMEAALTGGNFTLQMATYFISFSQKPACPKWMNMVESMRSRGGAQEKKNPFGNHKNGSKKNAPEI